GGGDPLSRPNPADVGFVDVDLDLQRVHVHDGADTGPGEAAARGDRRNHLAGLCILRYHHAGERRTYGHVVEGVAGERDAAFRDLDLFAAGGEAGREGVVIRFRRVQAGDAREFARGEVAQAVALEFRYPQLRLDLLERRPRRLRAGKGECELCAL